MEGIKMKKCIYCGKELKDNAVFCTSCGKRQEEIQEVQNVRAEEVHENQGIETKASKDVEDMEKIQVEPNKPNPNNEKTAAAPLNIKSEKSLLEKIRDIVLWLLTVDVAITTIMTIEYGMGGMAFILAITTIFFCPKFKPEWKRGRRILNTFGMWIVLYTVLFILGLVR